MSNVSIDHEKGQAREFVTKSNVMMFYKVAKLYIIINYVIASM